MHEEEFEIVLVTGRWGIVKSWFHIKGLLRKDMNTHADICTNMISVSVWYLKKSYSWHYTFEHATM